MDIPEQFWLYIAVFYASDKSEILLAVSLFNHTHKMGINMKLFFSKSILVA